MDANDKYLVLYTTDAFFYQYQIAYVPGILLSVFLLTLQGKSFHLTIVQQVMLSKNRSNLMNRLLLPSNTVLGGEDMTADHSNIIALTPIQGSKS